MADDDGTSDLLGIGKAIGDPIKQGIITAGSIKIKEMDNRKVRAMQREMTTRKRIQAEVDRTKIMEKYKAKRVGTFHEVSHRYIDESNEIISALDSTTFDAHIPLFRKGRVRAKLSPVSLAYLLGYVWPIFDDGISDRTVSQQNREIFGDMVRGAEHLKRVAAAGDLTFTDNSVNEGDDGPPIPPPPPDPEEDSISKDDKVNDGNGRHYYPKDEEGEPKDPKDITEEDVAETFQEVAKDVYHDPFGTTVKGIENLLIQLADQEKKLLKDMGGLKAALKLAEQTNLMGMNDPKIKEIKDQLAKMELQLSEIQAESKKQEKEREGR